MNILNILNIPNDKLKKISVALFFIMFIWSGIQKIYNFDSKVYKLSTKLPFLIDTELMTIICQLGILLVIFLEIIGSLIIYYYTFINKNNKNNKNNKYLVKIIYTLFLLFLIVVTFLYHPPSFTKSMIPFLSNLTTFSGLLYLYANLD